MMKANRHISEEEAQSMQNGTIIMVEGQKRVIDVIVGLKVQAVLRVRGFVQNHVLGEHLASS